MIKLKKKISIFFGTRPEFLKIRPILTKLNKNSYDLIYVKQHRNIKEKFSYTNIIKIPETGLNSRLNDITSIILSKKNIFKNEYVLIQGDTQTAMSIALSAFLHKKKVFHLEAGLRSFNNYSPYPEEVNRKIISTLANYHFCPTKLSKTNLINEGYNKNLYVTGNTCLDNILTFKDKCSYQNQIVITLHRRENLELYELWLDCINKLAKNNLNLKFYFILHPNPIYKKFIKKYKNIIFLNHMSHLRLMKFVINSKLLITDSGGLQEEGSFLNKKVIVCRKETERPEGIKTKHIYICKTPKSLMELFSKTIKSFEINKICPYGDGNSGLRIAKILKDVCN